MQRLTLAGRVPDQLQGSIVALGNFDGFHLGHQAVVGRAIARGFHERRPVIVATFDPHPVRFFKPEVPPFRLTTLDQREGLFAHAGADAMLVFEFGAELASMEAEAFVADVLAKRIGAAGVVTGDDFTFGKGRAGDVPLLARLGAEHGVAAEAVAQVVLDGERISSGRIREALVDGDTATRDAHAEPRLCDRRRRAARRRARARARLSDREPPARRLSAAEVRHLCGAGDAGRRERASGRRELRRPADLQPPEELLEAHLFGFDGDLYGRKIEVALHAYIREERKFDSAEALVAEMRNDEAAARSLLAVS